MNYEKVFAPGLVSRMERLHTALYDALPNKDLDCWIRGFIGENRPENEVRILECVAVVYLELVSESDLSAKEKESLYATLVMIVSGWVVPDMEARLPQGVPSLSMLGDQLESAYATNERP